MKEIAIPLMYLGQCENKKCKNFSCVPVHAVIDENELPKQCEKCGSQIKWETSIHPHNIESLKKKRSKSIRIWTTVPILSLLAFVIILWAYCHHQIYKSHSDQEMRIMMQKVESMSCSEILDIMIKDKLTMNSISRMLQTTPSTVIRLHTGQTTPTEGFEASIRQVYLDRLLIGSWWIVRLKYSIITKPDGFSCEINPLQER